MAVADSDPDAVKKIAVTTLQRTAADAFAIMAGMPTEAGEAVPDCPGQTSLRTVAGFIGWVGSWNGTGILECTPEFACKLANTLLGTSHTILNEDGLDAVAEMTNIIFGSMKTELERDLGAMGLSTPTVFHGNDIGVRSSGEPFTVIPLRIEGVAVWVKMQLVQVEVLPERFRTLRTARDSGAR